MIFQIRFVFKFRNNRFEQYLQNIDHSVEFVNDALATGSSARERENDDGSKMNLGSKMALLKSNRVMSKRLDHLLHQNTMWSKAVNPFQLSFSPHDPNRVRSMITSLGVLVQNGKKRNHVEQNHDDERKSVEFEDKFTFNIIDFLLFF